MLAGQLPAAAGQLPGSCRQLPGSCRQLPAACRQRPAVFRCRCRPAGARGQVFASLFGPYINGLMALHNSGPFPIGINPRRAGPPREVSFPGPQPGRGPFRSKKNIETNDNAQIGGEGHYCRICTDADWYGTSSTPRFRPTHSYRGAENVCSNSNCGIPLCARHMLPQSR